MQLKKAARSGNLSVSSSRFWDLAIAGYAWTSHTHFTDANRAYNLDFNKTAVNTSHDSRNRWTGFPLRCLARDYTFDTKSMLETPCISRGFLMFGEQYTDNIYKKIALA